MSANGAAAAQTLLAFSTWRAGYCLEAVWQAYKRNGASTNRSAATALIGWEKSDGKHHGDRNPPPGVPVWFGAKPTSGAGDVVISLGGGRVAATDWPRNGVIGVTTIDARQRQIGRPYLGWTETILGAPIAYSAPATTTPPPTPPQPQEEPEMGMQTIRNTETGAINFADEFGYDAADAYRSVDIEPGEYLTAQQKVFGNPTPVTARQFDIANAIALRRWERKKAEIVAALVPAVVEALVKELGKRS
ncbi:hypothetical protein [Microbacterium sp. NPDC087665]|uniref:hypothetical protein n=1 Tax=Microbacterium sp. NPDC087665 TaxID=3364194 RepID=UPI0038005677